MHNVRSVKKDTKLRSNTLLSLVSFFTEQTLSTLTKFIKAHNLMHIRVKLFKKPNLMHIVITYWMLESI